MKPKPFEIIMEFNPQSTKTGITYETYQKGLLIRCKNCEDCMKTKLFDGTRWNYCERLRCVVKDDDFCCWAELKYPKIKAKVTK